MVGDGEIPLVPLFERGRLVSPVLDRGIGGFLLLQRRNIPGVQAQLVGFQ